MRLIARRHVAGLVELDDREAADLGPMLRRCERVLARVTGAERIYTAALGEATPHFHAHMVPRTRTTPDGARGFALFELERAAAAGRVTVEPTEVARISAAYGAALAAEPPSWRR
jgi:diadenosine tetraphosphate (Ap4A) HIT family hydrolase